MEAVSMRCASQDLAQSESKNMMKKRNEEEFLDHIG